MARKKRDRGTTVLTYGTLPPRSKFVRHVGPKMRGGYPMELVGRDIEAAEMAINQGIDSHLEAIRFSQFGAGHKLGLRIADAESLYTFLRRLIEASESDMDSPAMELASAIMSTLEYEWV